MRLLLDESLPRRLRGYLESAEVRTVPEEGWGGLKNGELLTRAAESFDVFVTADQNLRYQQNLAGYNIGVVVLAAMSNRLEDLLSLVPAAREAVRTVRPGQVVVIKSDRDAGAS